MKVTKELEALVVSTLARMPADQFRKTLKAALDGRRIIPDNKPSVPKAKKKKLHWKTRQKLEREQAEKKKSA